MCLNWSKDDRLLLSEHQRLLNDRLQQQHGLSRAGCRSRKRRSIGSKNNQLSTGVDDDSAFFNFILFKYYL